VGANPVQVRPVSGAGDEVRAEADRRFRADAVDIAEAVGAAESLGRAGLRCVAGTVVADQELARRGDSLGGADVLGLYSYVGRARERRDVYGVIVVGIDARVEQHDVERRTVVAGRQGILPALDLQAEDAVVRQAAARERAGSR